jgi:ABC-2 type transport system permease protein
VWRLTRGSIAGWAVGGLLVGMLSTTLAGVVEEIGADNPAIEQILAQISGSGDLQQATITTFYTMLGILAACCAVQIVCRARQEESHGTAEVVLASIVGRVRWLSGYLIVALAGLVAVIVAGAAGSLAGLASQGGDDQLMRTVLVTGAGQVAAASVFLALTALAFVLAPRLTIPLGWTLVILGMVLGMFGPIFGFPEWLTQLSPMASAPVMQGDDVDLQGLGWLILAVGVGVGASLVLMRRRELTAGG